MDDCRPGGPGQARPKRAGKPVSFSSLLMLAGLLLVLFAGTLSLARYPWRQQLYRWGWADMPDAPADPTPLPEHLLLPAGTVGEPDDPADLAGLEGRLPLVPLGTIRLPVIGVAEHIVDGADSELLYGVGHVRDSALPGEKGNCVLAGHRNYIPMNPFRHLDMLEVGDAVLLEDEANRYTYEVFRTFEADPTELWIMEAQGEEEHLLTLLTCTPVVNPTRRLIVWCRLAEIQPLNQH